MKTDTLDPARRSVLNPIGWDRLARLASDRRLAFALTISLIALFGVARLLQATPYGPGLNGDSFYYYTGAENLAAGMGFGRIAGSGLFVPTTHFPPGYSWAMAGLQVLGIDKLDSGNLVNVLSFAGLIVVLAGMVRRESGSNLPAFVACAILVASPLMLESYAWAMSEPLYLLMAFGGIACFIRHLESHRTEWLIAASALIGLAWITRYVGVALVATGVAVLMLERVPWRTRLFKAGVFAAISTFPMALWLARNAALTGNLANRRVWWHPIGYAQLKALALHGLEWFVPADLVHGKWQALVMIAGILGIGGVLLWRLAQAGQLAIRFRLTGLPIVLGLHSIIYIASVAVSISLFDPATQIGGRILLPLYVSVMILATLLAWDVWRAHGRMVRLGLAASGLVVLTWTGVEQAKLASSIGQFGLGNAAPSIAESPTLIAAQALPDVPIVSNGMARLYFWADRNAYAIPWRVDVETGEPRDAYQSEVRNLQEILCRDDGALVLFGPETMLPEQAALADLTAGLIQTGKYPDGEIYRCSGGAGES